MSGLDPQQKQRVITNIDRIPQLKGVGIAFVGRGLCEVLRNPSLPSGYRTWVVLEESTTQAVATGGGASSPQRQSRLGSELLSAGLSCGSTGFAVAATTVGVAGAPFTGGASTAVTVLAWTATVASAAQCGVGLGRVINEIFEPSNNDLLDSNEWFERTGQALDAISLAGGLASLGQAARAVIQLSRSTGKPITQILKGLTRAERKRLAQDLAKYAGDAPTRRQFIRLARAGKLPKIFTNAQIQSAIQKHLLEAVGGALDIGGSSRSGVVHEVLVHIAEDDG